MILVRTYQVLYCIFCSVVLGDFYFEVRGKGTAAQDITGSYQVQDTSMVQQTSTKKGRLRFTAKTKFGGCYAEDSGERTRF